MRINHQFKSKNYSNREGSNVEFLVLHYTAVPLSTTLGIFTNNSQLAKADEDFFMGTMLDPVVLCEQKVSAHYVNSEQGEIYQLVDEEFSSYHAGISYWNGKHNINQYSIGIEQENLGFNWIKEVPTERAVKVTGSKHIWCNYNEQQLAATIELCHKIIKQYNLKPYNIVGHSDIACGRKVDPGPLFPWQLLAEEGIGLWYDIKESSWQRIPENYIQWTQEKLFEYGYNCPITGKLDETTLAVIQSFQMHFRAHNISGTIDLESMQILESLCLRKRAYQLQERLTLGSKSFLPN